MPTDRIGQYLAKRSEQETLRRLTVLDDAIDFSSNDYLGFSRSAWIYQQVEQQMKELRFDRQSATASRLLNGNNAFIEDLEKELAAFHRAEAGLIFNSGYDANVGLIGTVVRPGDVILMDEYSHASMHQGAKLSGAECFLYRHNDAIHLEELLATKVNGRTAWVITESLFSMEGDKAPLSAISTLCREYNAELIVDEAHANGVYGAAGTGLCFDEKVVNECFARVYTFGKALGAHGAIVVGSKLLRDYLINFSKPLIYSTALPVHTLGRIKAAYAFLQKSDKARQSLHKLIAYFNGKKALLPYSVVGDGPVFGVMIPGNNAVRSVAAHLQEQGFDIRPIVSPTVPAGKERLRVSLHSFNTVEQIDDLVRILQVSKPQQ